MKEIYSMNNTYKIWLLLPAVLLCWACTKNNQKEREVIHQAEQLLQEQPDSALHLLQTIDRHSLRNETLARYALVYSIAQDISGLDVSSDSLLRIAYDYYCQHPKDSLYARCQYYMGKYLWLTEQPDSAYNCLLKARTVSEADNDYYTAYLATDKMRRITEVSDPALCLTLSKEAYYLYLRNGLDNPVNETYLLIGIGDSYHRLNEKDSTLYYYNKALKKAKSSCDTIAIASILQNISIYYLSNKEFEKALNYSEQILHYQGYVDMSLAMLLAQCYTENEEYDKAWQYIKALPHTESKEKQLVKLGTTHRLYAKIGNADATQEYFDSAIDVAADMYMETQKEKLNLYRKNMHEAMQRQQAEHQRTLSVLFSVFSLILLLLILWLFIKYRRTNEKEKAYKEYMIDQTRNYVKKIVSIRQRLDEEKGNNIKFLSLDNNDWNEIQAYLQACDNSFVTRFKDKFPTLSEEEYHLCLLLRFGFTNPDLELVFPISSQGVKNKQRLLKKKLGLFDEKTSLRQYIQKF